MNYFIKTTTILFLLAIIFQSCTSDECEKDVISDEQKISTDLAEKIIATATSKNDISLVNPECAPTTFGISSSMIFFYFLNPQGDYYSASLPMTEWERYPEVKELAYEDTGIRFTDDDFFIFDILTKNATFIYKRENIIDYFEDCEYIGDTDLNLNDPYFSVSISETNFNCDASVKCWVDRNQLFSGEEIHLSEGLNAIENELITYNTDNNTNHTLDDVRVTTLSYTSPAGTNGYSLKREEILNYFDGCLLDRDINNNDCLNFIYPLQVNRFNLQLEEVITTTIENDEDLITTFSTDVGELGFVFPISLLGQDGSIVNIETNEALENALDNSFTYCH